MLFRSLGAARRHSHVLVATADEMWATIGWYAEYSKFKDSMSHEEASFLADHAVRQGVGSTGMVDSPFLLQFGGSGTASKAFRMTFGFVINFFSHQGNRLREGNRWAVRALEEMLDKNPSKAAEASGRASALYAVYLFIPVAIEMLISKELLDKDKLNIPGYLAGIATFPLKGIPVVRDVASAVLAGKPPESVLNSGMKSLGKVAQDTQKAIKEAQGGANAETIIGHALDHGVIQHTADTAGMALKLPGAHQAGKSLTFISDRVRHPENLGDPYSFANDIKQAATFLLGEYKKPGTKKEAATAPTPINHH